MFRILLSFAVVVAASARALGQSAESPDIPPGASIPGAATPAFDALTQTQATTPAPGAAPAGTAAPAADDGFDNGNDPSKVRKRFSFRSETSRFGNGLWVTTNTAQASFPILSEGKLKANFGFDVPMNYYQVASPVSTALSGLGDLKANVMFVRPLTERVTGLLGVNLWMPTAEQGLLQLPNRNTFTSVDLGTGTFRLEPLVGAVFFASKELFIVPLYAHDLSFAKKPGAVSINRGTARLFINYSLPQGFYVSHESQFLINYNLGNDLDAFQRLEVGKAFKNGTVFYIKPGVGIAPGPFNREWGIEGGIRFVF